ncbi:YcaO-like family protein, partial [Pseudonocardia pini]|uniref:YcaO-like family protein n=1 Tax=Pseudonocardia pini TaxID=2758030 RepID=UPI0015F057C1
TGDDPGRTVRLLRIPSEFDVPVLAAFVEDPAGLVAFGSACRADPREAAAKALVEAYAMLALTAEVADPDSALWQAVARGELAAHTFRPFRADRRYLDDFRPDLRDVTDLPTLAQYYLDPRRQGAPLDRLRVGPELALDDVPPGSDPLPQLAAAGLPAYAVDLTTPDVRAAGLSVVRVVVPGLYGNAPAAFPHLGGDRLHRVPAEQGWIAAPTTEDTLYPYPIPQI